MCEDARRYATSVIEHLQTAYSNSTFCCYGTQERVLVGIDRDSSLERIKTDTFDAVWTDINEYIEANSNQYIFGFIGFDPANQLNHSLENYQQKIDLFIPGIVIECNRSGITLLKGDIDISSINMQSEFVNTNLIGISDFDLSESDKQYTDSVSHFIHAIQAKTLERATLARKINTHRAFDLLATFASDHSQHKLARNFYFSNKYISFAGQSPEVLAEGNTQSFATHKLSGTYAKDNALSIEALSLRFQTDQRIVAEHQSSIAAIEKSLTDIGSVKATKFKVMELPTLLHGWSQFETQTNNNVTVANCLRSIFPFGVNPVTQGFELLAQHEDFCRGPYYGLTGYVLPDGEFSFTQVLRSAFTDQKNSYLMAGAAITGLSTPELEVAETRNKLSGIRAFEQFDTSDNNGGQCQNWADPAGG